MHNQDDVFEAIFTHKRNQGPFVPASFESGISFSLFLSFLLPLSFFLFFF
jgi:hypothetical protein